MKKITKKKMMPSANTMYNSGGVISGVRSVMHHNPVYIPHMQDGGGMQQQQPDPGQQQQQPDPSQQGQGSDQQMQQIAQQFLQAFQQLPPQAQQMVLQALTSQQ